jgi:serine/threonine protein kinase
VFNRIYNKKIFGGKNLIFKLGDYGVCLPLYENSFSKSQFMGTLHYMAPEIYKMRTEKEHPIYTKKIDLFSLGQSILCMMGFIKKASPLNEEKIEEIKNICTLFEGNEKEKLLADLIFNHLLICNPDKRDNWEEYLNHPLFK